MSLQTLEGFVKGEHNLVGRSLYQSCFRAGMSRAFVDSMMTMLWSSNDYDSSDHNPFDDMKFGP